MRGTPVAIALACFAAAACANLFGYQDLRVGDDLGDGGSAGDDSGTLPVDGASPSHDSGGGGGGGGGGGLDAPSDRFIQNPGDSGPSGVCNPDITTSCSDPSQVAFSCTGTAKPTDQFTGLTCGSGSTQTGATSYCCAGNWCGDTPNPNDSPSCQSCYTASCTGPVCMCDTEQGPPDGGENLCNTYEDCVYACIANSPLSQCQDSCAPQFNQVDVNLANAGINCYVQYCATDCGW